MDNTSILIFNAISCFLKDLNLEYGQKYKNILLYNRLIEKTSLSNVGPINKHINSFREFFNSNKTGMEEKNFELFEEPSVKYSENCYVNIKLLFKNSNKENSQIIWKHLLTIWGLIDPTSHAKKLLKSSIESKNEVDFLSNIIDKVEKSVSDGNIDTNNPMAAVSSLMQSGIFNDLISGMQTGLSNGQLDIGKMMGGITSMINKMSPDGNIPPEISGMMSMMSGMVEKQTCSAVEVEETTPPPSPSDLEKKED